MPHVYDTFMFADELDVLECRLTELENADVTHVLAEAAADHHGNSKPLYFADNKSRFSKWQNRIIHIIVHDFGSVPPDDPWSREQAHREFCRLGLQNADPDDIVIHSDADEILTEKAVSAVRNMAEEGLRLRLRHFIFACDWEIIGGEIWDKPVATRLRNIDSFTWLRRMNHFPAAEGDMGWHLSFFGGPGAIRKKLSRDCHPEMRERTLQYVNEGRCYEKGEFPFDIKQAAPVDVNETWPRYICEGRAPASWFRPR